MIESGSRGYSRWLEQYSLSIVLNCACRSRRSVFGSSKVILPKPAPMTYSPPLCGVSHTLVNWTGRITASIVIGSSSSSKAGVNLKERFKLFPFAFHRNMVWYQNCRKKTKFCIKAVQVFGKTTKVYLTNVLTGCCSVMQRMDMLIGWWHGGGVRKFTIWIDPKACPGFNLMP